MKLSNEDLRKLITKSNIKECELPFDDDDPYACEACHYDNSPLLGGLYGWICPKCGAVMSPYTAFCVNCTNRNLNITYTTTGTADNTETNYHFEVGV